MVYVGVRLTSHGVPVLFDATANRRARGGEANTVPGMRAEYEAPEHPDLTIHGDRENAEAAAAEVIVELRERGYRQL